MRWHAPGGALPARVASDLAPVLAQRPEVFEQPTFLKMWYDKLFVAGGVVFMGGSLWGAYNCASRLVFGGTKREGY